MAEILTRQQLEDAARCSEHYCGADCSMFQTGSTTLDGCIEQPAQTALALMNKIEAQQEVLKMARNALYSAIVTHLEAGFTVGVAGWQKTLVAIDKALGEHQ